MISPHGRPTDRYDMLSLFMMAIAILMVIAGIGTVAYVILGEFHLVKVSANKIFTIVFGVALSILGWKGIAIAQRIRVYGEEKKYQKTQTALANNLRSVLGNKLSQSFIDRIVQNTLETKKAVAWDLQGAQETRKKWDLFFAKKQFFRKAEIFQAAEAIGHQSAIIYWAIEAKANALWLFRDQWVIHEVYPDLVVIRTQTKKGMQKREISRDDIASFEVSNHHPYSLLLRTRSGEKITFGKALSPNHARDLLATITSGMGLPQRIVV